MADDARLREDLAALLAAHPVRNLDRFEPRVEAVVLELLKRPAHGGLGARRAREPRADGVGQLLEARVCDAVRERAAQQKVGDVGGN